LACWASFVSTFIEKANPAASIVRTKMEIITMTSAMPVWGVERPSVIRRSLRSKEIFIADGLEGYSLSEEL